MATMWVDEHANYQVRFSQKENSKLRNGAHVKLLLGSEVQLIYAPSKDWRYSKNARVVVSK